jgi:purine-binding chemotaxis protein CheW
MTFIPPSSTEPTSALLIVSFRLGPQQYGLPIEAVREVVRMPALTALAGAPPTLCGLLNLRGSYLPVLDGRALVGEPPYCDLSSQIIVVGRAQPQLGLLVDQVDQVARFDQSLCTPLKRGVAMALLDMVVETSSGSLLVISLAELEALAADSRAAAGAAQ